METEIINDLMRKIDINEQLLCRTYGSLREIRKQLINADNNAIAVMSAIKAINELLELYLWQVG